MNEFIYRIVVGKGGSTGGKPLRSKWVWYVGVMVSDNKSKKENTRKKHSGI